VQSLQVYGRQGCHLCELLLEDLLPLVRHTFEVEVIDIDRSAGLVEAYGTRIPVVEYQGRPVCQYHLDRDAISELIAAAGGS